jgi:ABC-type transport system substrate-binding protein
MRRLSILRLSAAVVLAAVVAGGCGTSSPQPDHSAGTLPGGTIPSVPTSPTTLAPAGTSTPYATQATIQLGLYGGTDNWNILARRPHPARPDNALATVADAVWPSAFAVGPDSGVTRNANLVVSATETTADPQTIVYEINSRAIWSDGTRITGADFIFTWEAQSGRRAFRDTAGRLFTPESTAGYDRIATVTSGASAPDQVVVTFKRPDADWQALFSPIIPAHVAQQVGFDHGFANPVTSLVSAGPFEVQSYQPGAGIILVRNPLWWGPAANLASVDITFVLSATEATDGVEQSALDAAVTALQTTALERVRATTGLVATVSPSATYDDLVANERARPLWSRVLRLAIYDTVDRSPVVTAAQAAGDTGAAAVDNRGLLPGQPGYSDDSSAATSALSGRGGVATTTTTSPGPATTAAATTTTTTTTTTATTSTTTAVRGTVSTGAPLAQARLALEAAGFTVRDGHLRYHGRVVRLSLGVATTTPFAASETAAISSACAALAISLTILRTPPPVEASRVAAGRYDLAIVAARVAPFPTALAATYATKGRANFTGYSTPAMDALLAALWRPGAGRSAVVADVDRLAWADGIDLPLVAQPSVLVAQARYLNLVPSPAGIGWNIASWGVLAGT